MMKTANGGTIAVRVLYACAIFSAIGFVAKLLAGPYDYTSPGIQHWDSTRPAQTEPGSNLGPATRQIKKCVEEWVDIEHNRDGTHKTNVTVYGSQIVEGSITASRLADGAVTAGKLATGVGGPVFITPVTLDNANVTKTGAWVAWAVTGVPTNAMAVIVWAKWDSRQQDRYGQLNARQPTTGSSLPVVANRSAGNGDVVGTSSMAIVPCTSGAIEYQVSNYDNGTIDLVVYGYWR